MLDPGSYDGTYEPNAGQLCLDFANTISWRYDDRRHDWLQHYPNLVAWGELVGILPAETAHALRGAAARLPAAAERVLEQAVELREGIYRVFSAVAAGRSAAAADLALLNAALSEALPQLRVAPSGEAFAWDWAADEEALDRILWPVVRSSAELLTSDEVGRVGECAGESCGWLFMDLSRNRSRRWCAMGDCGNRAKARRHYRRKRKALAAEPS